MATPTRKRSYEERAKSVPNATSRAFLELIVRKRSNLAIAADVRTSTELLKIADQLGPYICLLKTHIDILDDFEPSLPAKLQELAIKHDFMIFEDRKFADIGNTSKQQYEGGVYKIVEWSHITNAQTVPGPGIISGLKEAGLPRGRGLLLLAEMSSAGSLAVGSYTEATIEMAKQHRDFVIGFVGSKQLTEDDTFIVLTPGVSLESSGDALGQQYNTPDSVIRLRGSDVIIVGRGIYQAADPIAAAITYRDVGWKAYEASL